MFTILYMSCTKWKGWTTIFFIGGGGEFFRQKYFFVTKSFGDLCTNFISVACNVFLCFVLLRTIFISFAKAV